ncbi:uncharacterized protein TrAFT101_009222 [Trichoderma asperellum]|uniref:uncharacterized protein n=1 Tax=Trichoderma asperellum TaxID=101201 RepID=UPI00331C9D07|nr:hypothetical protein TrAFT101_009222 [Trichoderma asperellum]
MPFLTGPNGEQVVPIRINGVSEPLDPTRLIPIESNGQDKIVHYAQSATPEIAIKAVDASHRAYLKWKNTSYVERRDLLLRVADVIDSWVERFAQLQAEETSSTIAWGRANAFILTRFIREIATSISDATTGEIPPLEQPGAIALVYKEPVGVVLTITPWNASMILCGKMCPRTHHTIVEAFEEAGMPNGLINVVQASREDGPATTEALIAHRAIRKVAFTGSAAVGRIICQTASRYLKPVLMELGGKAPAIVLKDADVELAADKIIYGAFLHHGQICMSTDRIIVVQELADELIQAMKIALKARFPDGAGYAGSKRLAKRAHDLLQKAHAAGAHFVIGDGSLNADGSNLTPTIVTDIKPTDEIFHEEIFSPAAILTIVKDEAEAVLFANDTLHGRNASVHSRDILAAIRVAKQIEAGQVHIGNLTEFDEPNIPFGGTKDSGWGRNNGKYALNEFLIDKTITILDPAADEIRFGK